ncbi:MAG TPA: hypothetical protein VEA60_00205 [Allosphingosinicella sp.]|nr:hypothetical protein [Allosphingosinicella sp.]
MPQNGYRRAAARAAKPAAGGKDFWDKLAALTTPLATLTLGFVGAYVTYTYNQADLRQKNRIAQAEVDQRAQDASNQRTFAETETLQKLFEYVSSADPQKREFGYAMYAAIGRGELAAHLISLKQDKAGAAVLRGLASDRSLRVRASAVAALTALAAADRPSDRIDMAVLSSTFSRPQRTALRGLVARAESSDRYDMALRGAGGDIYYGLGSASAKTGELSDIVTRYCRDPEAIRRELCRDPRALTRGVSDRQFALLKAAAAEPAMQRAQEAHFERSLARTATQTSPLITRLGLQLPLSKATVVDIARQMGPVSADRMAATASRQLGGSPADGKDEKAWVKALLAARRDYIASRYPGLSQAADFRRSVIDAYIARDDWQMAATPEEGAEVDSDAERPAEEEAPPAVDDSANPRPAEPSPSDA